MAMTDIQRLTKAVEDLTRSVRQLELILRQSLKAHKALLNELTVLNATTGAVNQLRKAAGLPPPPVTNDEGVHDA